MLTAFLETFQHPPDIIFTDEGAGMLCAIRKLQRTGPLLGSTNLLCMWHMSLRLRKQCKGAFANKLDWERFCGEWWKIVKDSEAGLSDVETRIAGKLATLRTMVTTGEGAPDRVEVAQQHMDKLVEIRQQWAGCYTHGLATYGCRTTQRCEGLHGSLRTCLSANMTLTDCCGNLEHFVERKHISDSVAERNFCCGRPHANGCSRGRATY